MKCGALDKLDLAKAYKRAANDAGEAEVTIDHLAPHLAATGSSCGLCPALLPLAKKAFESHKGALELNADKSEPMGAEVPVLNIIPTRDI